MNSEAYVKVAKAIDSTVPPLVAASTVAVVCTQGQSVVQIGSGTLLAIADARFVITAAHVALTAKMMGGTLGIGAMKAGALMALTGDWMLSASDAGSEDGGKYDIGLYRLSSQEIERLSGCEFVRLSDIDFVSDLSNGYFVLCGFPSVWSINSDGPAKDLVLRPILYGAWTHSGSSSGLKDVDMEHHLLLQASPEILLDHEGHTATMRTRSNHWVGMPGGLRGISGCSVWMIGNITLPPEVWTLLPARIVGIETGVFEGKTPTIKATKWRAALSLLHRAFPDLRAAIEMHVDHVNAPG